MVVAEEVAVVEVSEEVVEVAVAVEVEVSEEVVEEGEQCSALEVEEPEVGEVGEE